MREQWARRLAVATGLMVIALSALMASRFEAVAGEGDEKGVQVQLGVDPEQLARGAALFEQEGCSGCHSVAGQGNPRSPLDGVSRRLDAAELRAWTVGDPTVADALPRRTALLKQGYADLSEDELEALIAWLGSI